MRINLPPKHNYVMLANVDRRAEWVDFPPKPKYVNALSQERRWCSGSTSVHQIEDGGSKPTPALEITMTRPADYESEGEFHNQRRRKHLRAF